MGPDERLISPKLFIATISGDIICEIDTMGVTIEKTFSDEEMERAQRNFGVVPFNQPEITVEVEKLSNEAYFALMGINVKKFKRSAIGKYLCKCQSRGDFYRHNPKKKKKNKRNY